MYEYLRRLYLAGSLSDAGLQNAVTKGWITQTQADQIRADKAAQGGATVTETDGVMAAAAPKRDSQSNKEQAEVLQAVVLTLLQG